MERRKKYERAMSAHPPIANDMPSEYPNGFINDLDRYWQMIYRLSRTKCAEVIISDVRLFLPIFSNRPQMVFFSFSWMAVFFLTFYLEFWCTCEPLIIAAWPTEWMNGCGRMLTCCIKFVTSLRLRRESERDIDTNRLASTAAAAVAVKYAKSMPVARQSALLLLSAALCWPVIEWQFENWNCCWRVCSCECASISFYSSKLCVNVSDERRHSN